MTIFHVNPLPLSPPCLLDGMQAWRRDNDDSARWEDPFISMWIIGYDIKTAIGPPSLPFFKSSAQARVVYLWADSHLNVTWTESCSLLWKSWYISGWIEGLGLMSSTLIHFLTTWLQYLLHHQSKEITTFHSWCTFSRGLMALLFPLQIMSGASQQKKTNQPIFREINDMGSNDVSEVKWGGFCPGDCVTCRFAR